MSSIYRASESDTRICVVGYGYWGPNLARNFATVPDGLLYAVCDSDVGSLERARQQHPWIKTFERHDDVLNDPAVDAIALTTPTYTHYGMARAAVEADKHVPVEKPLATRSEECCELIACAESRNMVLMVGHTFLFSPAVQHLKTLVQWGELGDLYYLYGSRLNLGIIRPDVNVLWDLGPHDILIVLYLIDDLPIAVSARGFCHVRPAVEVVDFVTLEFASGLSAHLHMSWLDPNKVRKMTVSVLEAAQSSMRPTECESVLPSKAVR